ncbi:MAG: efflux RND transporter periplasmic adaptor subunit [Polyangiaceae bacterium]
MNPSHIGPVGIFLLAANLSASGCGQHSPQQTTDAAPKTNEHAGHVMTDSASSMAGAMPSGYSAVTLDPNRVEALGLSTFKVEHRSFDKSVRTVGIVTLDETRTAHVHAKVRGFVETIQVDFVGKTVKAGTSLCSIYSQGVYAAELEYIALLKNAPAQGGEPLTADIEKKSWNSLLDAARRRLLLWDVPQAQIDHLEKTLVPSRTFTLSAPRSGIVIAKQAFVGNYVEPGTEMYVISDLAKLWAIVDVYEVDLPYIHLDDEVKLTIEGLAEPLTAKVSFLSPTISEATRTLKIRVDLDNKSGTLRPGAFATAELKLSLGHGLGIPESSVLHTGARDIVFVVHGTHVVPREVKVGPLVGGYNRVDSGVEDGESVAVGAQFLIDSESRLQATTNTGGAHVGHAGH